MEEPYFFSTGSYGLRFFPKDLSCLPDIDISLIYFTVVESVLFMLGFFYTFYDLFITELSLGVGGLSFIFFPIYTSC